MVAKTKKPHVLGQIIMVEEAGCPFQAQWPGKPSNEMVTFQQRLGGGEGAAMEISRERAFLAEGAPSSGGWITHVHSNSINQRLE